MHLLSLRFLFLIYDNKNELIKLTCDVIFFQFVPFTFLLVTFSYDKVWLLSSLFTCDCCTWTMWT